MLPPVPTHVWDNASSQATPRAGDQLHSPITPGFAISLATPAIQGAPGVSSSISGTVRENGSHVNGENSGLSPARQSLDYFSSSVSPTPGFSPSLTRDATTPALPSEAGGKTPAAEESKESTEQKDTSSKFGKKFRMNMSFPKMKLGRNSTSDKDKSADDKKDDNDSDAKSSSTDDSRQVEDNFLGCVQKIRFEYRDKLQALAPQTSSTNTADGTLGATEALELETLITPSLPNETPVLKPPANTTILIQVDRPEAGGMADLFEGTVGSLPENIDTIEKVAPMWLGEALLRNSILEKDVVKISFVLDPWQDSLPAVASEGNNRLNANRMLRARKILAYVAERMEYTPESGSPKPDTTPETAEGHDGEALRPEEYLELWCNNQLIPPAMTLATIRAHVWRGGGDVCLYYKANGRKEIKAATSA